MDKYYRDTSGDDLVAIRLQFGGDSATIRRRITTESAAIRGDSLISDTQPEAEPEAEPESSASGSGIWKLGPHLHLL